MFSKRRLKILAAAAAAIAASTSIGAARDLTVVAWGGLGQEAQSAAFMKPFSQMTGKAVLEDTWSGGYGVLRAKMQGGAPNWDVVQVEAEELALGCADGIYEKIDWARMGELKNQLLPNSVSECGVGATYWSMVMSYDGAYFKNGPKSWADFWDVNRFPGKRSLRKGPKYSLEFALLADGVPADQLYDVLSTPKGVDRAFAKLDELKPNILWWEAGAQPVQYLVSGEATIAAVYNGRIPALNEKEGRDFRLVWPGSIYAIDSWIILKGAENADLAQDFLKFASQAEPQAKFQTLQPYGVPNKGAAALVQPEVAKYLPTNPANLAGALQLNTDFWIDHTEALTQRFNAWLGQ